MKKLKQFATGKLGQNWRETSHEKHDEKTDNAVEKYEKTSKRKNKEKNVTWKRAILKRNRNKTNAEKKRAKHDIKKDKTSQSEEQYYVEKGKYGQNE